MLPQIKPFAFEQALAGLSADQLAPIVSRLLAEPVQVTDWQVTLLGGLDSSPMAGGVYRLSGTAVTSSNVLCRVPAGS